MKTIWLTVRIDGRWHLLSKIHSYDSESTCFVLLTSENSFPNRRAAARHATKLWVEDSEYPEKPLSKA